MFVCFNSTPNKVGKTDFFGELEKEDFLAKGDAVGVGDVVAAAGMEAKKALFSPSSAALGHSLFRLFPALFRLFPALSLAVQGEERLDFSRTLDSSKLPFRCIQCAAREGARTRLSSWVQPRHPKQLRQTRARWYSS